MAYIRHWHAAHINLINSQYKPIDEYQQADTVDTSQYQQILSVHQQPVSGVEFFLRLCYS